MTVHQQPHRLSRSACDAQVSRMGDSVPPMFWLRGPDNHSLMVVEQR
jgi:hypothetical protein